MGKFKPDYGGKTDKYSWTQSKEEVIITVPVPAGTRGKDVECTIHARSLKLNLKGQPTIINGQLHRNISVDDSTWTLDNNTVEITMLKGAHTGLPWWSCAIVGDPEVDVQKIEGSQYVDSALLDRLEREAKEKEEEEAKQKAAEGTSSSTTSEPAK